MNGSDSDYGFLEYNSYHTIVTKKWSKSFLLQNRYKKMINKDWNKKKHHNYFEQKENYLTGVLLHGIHVLHSF